MFCCRGRNLDLKKYLLLLKVLVTFVTRFFFFFFFVGHGRGENEKTRLYILLLLYMVIVGAVENLVCLPVAS